VEALENHLGSEEAYEYLQSIKSWTLEDTSIEIRNILYTAEREYYEDPSGEVNHRFKDPSINGRLRALLYHESDLKNQDYWEGIKKYRLLIGQELGGEYDQKIAEEALRREEEEAGDGQAKETN
jgi:hypothetical protein